MVGTGPLLQEFFRLRLQYEGKPIPRRIYKRWLEQAESYLKWCSKEGVKDTSGFLRYRFDCSRHSGYSLDLRRLRSLALAAAWKTWREGEYQEEQAGVRLSDSAGTARQQEVKALRLLTRGQEAAKQPYVSASQTSMCVASQEYTGGFHPESRFCPLCPSAVRCAAQLYARHGFDVVALRRGRFQELPREVAAAAVR